jgi:hypothetical protein
MAGALLDHVITYTRAKTIEQALDQYRAQGFDVASRTVRHDPGLRNGFIVLGGEYLELCWVEDEDAFASAELMERHWRQSPGVGGVGITSSRLETVRNRLLEAGLELAEITEGRPRDAAPDDPPTWRFLELPEGTLEGTWAFFLQYLTRDDGTKDVGIAPNGIYAMEGFTSVSATPSTAAAQWRLILGPTAEIDQRDETQATMVSGPFNLTWVTPERYRELFGVDFEHAVFTIAHIDVLTTDLIRTETILAGRAPTRRRGPDGDTLFVPPLRDDGVAFLVREVDPAEWSAGRSAVTGEILRLVGSDETQ